MKVVGYCTIDRNAKTDHCTHPEKFLGRDVRVLEFDKWGGVLVISADATAMGMFDKEDIYRKFECSVNGIYIFPPNLNLMEEMLYTGLYMQRRGGYNDLVRNMIIQMSLARGKFTDDFLWTMDNAPLKKQYEMHRHAMTQTFKNKPNHGKKEDHSPSA